ncbi:MAG: MBL fold metallo-hydrolase [Patescibacteria group bacterium]
MVINWYGEACFKIQSGEFVLMTDPFESSTGLTPPRFKASLTLRTRIEKPLPYRHEDTPTIEGPGEYEVAGNQVTGVHLPASPKEILTAYTVFLEDMKIGLLGHATEMPAPDALELLAGSDILIVPAGGTPFLAVEGVAKIVKQVNPKIVIPSLFKISGLTRKAGDIKAFLDELGQKPDAEEKFVTKKKDLPTGMQVKVLRI